MSAPRVRYSKVFTGPQHRARFRAELWGTNPRRFIVEVLLKTYHANTPFSQGDLAYFDYDLDAAWDTLRTYVPDASWPREWKPLLDDAECTERFEITEAPGLRVLLPLRGLLSPVDNNGRVCYTKERWACWMASLFEVSLEGRGGTKKEALADLTNRVVKLYNTFAACDWKVDAYERSPYGDGFARPLARLLHSRLESV